MFQEFPVQVFNGCLLSISLKASEDSWKLNCSHLHGNWGTPRRIGALLSSSSAFREIPLTAATFLTPNHPPRSLRAAPVEEGRSSFAQGWLWGRQAPSHQPALAFPCPRAHCPEQSSPPGSFFFPSHSLLACFHSAIPHLWDKDIPVAAAEVNLLSSKSNFQQISS